MGIQFHYTKVNVDFNAINSRGIIALNSEVNKIHVNPAFTETFIRKLNNC